MSFEDSRHVLTNMRHVISGVRDNVIDDVYSGLGKMQAVSIVVMTCAAFYGFYPESSWSPINRLYETIDGVTEEEYHLTDVLLAAFHYSLWVFMSSAAGIFIGKRTGDAQWSTYCLVKTGFRSRHTMDLPLSARQLARVERHLVMVFNPDGGVETIDRAQLRHWIQQVHLLFSHKRAHQLACGNVHAAEEWWLVKRDFFRHYHIEVLYNKVMDYVLTLTGYLDNVRAYQRQLAPCLRACQADRIDLNAQKSTILQLLSDMRAQLGDSVSQRASRQHRQRIYQDVKVIDAMTTLIATTRHLSATRFKKSVTQLQSMLAGLQRRIERALDEVPQTPAWLAAILRDAMDAYHKQVQHRVTLQAAKVVLSTLDLIANPEQRRTQSRVIAQLFLHALRAPDTASAASLSPLDTREGSASEEIMVRVNSADGLALLHNRHTPLARDGVNTVGGLGQLNS